MARNPMLDGAINGVDDSSQPGFRRVQANPAVGTINGANDPTQSVYRPAKVAPAPLDPASYAGPVGGAATPSASPLSNLASVQGAAAATQPLPNENGGQTLGRYIRGAANLAQVPGEAAVNLIGGGLNKAADFGAGVVSGLTGVPPQQPAPAVTPPVRPIQAAAALTPPAPLAPTGTEPNTSTPNYFARPSDAPAATSTPLASPAAPDAVAAAMKSNAPGTAVINGRIVSPQEIADLARKPTGADDPNSTYNQSVAYNHELAVNRGGSVDSQVDNARAAAANVGRDFNSQLARASDPFDPVGRQIIAARHAFENAGDIKSRIAAGIQLKALLGGLAEGGHAEAAAKTGAENAGLSSQTQLANTGLGQQGEFARTALQQQGETQRLTQTQNAPTPELDQDGNYRLRTGGTVTPITDASGKQAAAPLGAQLSEAGRALPSALSAIQNNPTMTQDEKDAATDHLITAVRRAGTPGAPKPQAAGVPQGAKPGDTYTLKDGTTVRINANGQPEKVGK